MLFFSNNFLKLNIYYEDLNFENITETPEIEVSVDQKIRTELSITNTYFQSPERGFTFVRNTKTRRLL